MTTESRLRAPSATSSAPTPLAADLERIVMGGVGLTTRVLAQAETGFELTFTQWRAILVVGSNPDGARVGEVAARVGVTLPATSRLLRRLERRGLATLGPDASDRRATRVRLTERGHEIRSAILTRRRAMLEQVIERLPGSRVDLAAGLALIADQLDRFA